MEFTVEWGGHPQDVLVATHGPVSVDDVKRLIVTVLADERYRPGMKVLIDQSELDEDVLTDDGVRAVAAFVVERRKELEGTAVAVVSPSPEHYGFTQTWRMYAEQELGNLLGVFYSRNAAADWLARLAETP